MTGDKTELNIWNMQSLSCVQTVRFKIANGKSCDILLQQADSSSYIVLTEFTQRVMYVIEFDNIVKLPAETIQTTPISSIAKYPFPSCALTLSFLGSKMHSFECNDIDLKIHKTVIYLFVLQTECIQEYNFVFKPEVYNRFDNALKAEVSSDSNRLAVIQGGENSLKYIITPGFRDSSNLVYVIKEKNLFVGKEKRNNGKSYVCYQTILCKKDQTQVKCSARVKIDKNGDCQRNHVDHSSHPNHEMIYNDMNTAHSMKDVCKQLQGLLGSSARKISSREVFNRQLAT